MKISMRGSEWNDSGYPCLIDRADAAPANGKLKTCDAATHVNVDMVSLVSPFLTCICGCL
jgi:hypothetical protein